MWHRALSHCGGGPSRGDYWRQPVRVHHGRAVGGQRAVVVWPGGDQPRQGAPRGVPNRAGCCSCFIVARTRDRARPRDSAQRCKFGDDKRPCDPGAESRSVDPAMRALLLILAAGGAVGQDYNCIGQARFAVTPNCGSGKPQGISDDEFTYITNALLPESSGFFDQVNCDPNALKVGDNLSFSYKIESQCQLDSFSSVYVDSNDVRRPPPRVRPRAPRAASCSRDALAQFVPPCGMTAGGEYSAFLVCQDQACDQPVSGVFKARSRPPRRRLAGCLDPPPSPAATSAVPPPATVHNVGAGDRHGL